MLKKQTASWLREYERNGEESPLEDCKLTQLACEQYHRIGWNESRIIQVENNNK
jgi:hypothetical protein